jgi:hypothetical protein
MIFNEDDSFKKGDVMNSAVKGYIKELIFTDAKLYNDEIRSFDVVSITLEEKRVDTLSKYLDRFADKYDLDKIASLPSTPIRMGDIIVADKETGELSEYLYLLDKMNI